MKNRKFAYLFIVTLLLHGTSCALLQKKEKPKLKDYFSIEFSFEKDTVLYGDTIDVRIAIKNVSDTELILFPNPWCYMNHPYGEELGRYEDSVNPLFYDFSGFGAKNNPVFNVYKKLSPNETYLFVMPIYITDFFYYGNNVINAFFVYNEKSPKYSGALMSAPVKLYVKRRP